MRNKILSIGNYYCEKQINDNMLRAVNRLLLKIMFTGLHLQSMVHNNFFHIHDKIICNNNIKMSNF